MDTVGWLEMPLQPPDILYSPALSQNTAPGICCKEKAHCGVVCQAIVGVEALDLDILLLLPDGLFN